MVVGKKEALPFVTLLCPVEIFSVTPRFNAVGCKPAERKTVSNGFSLA